MIGSFDAIGVEYLTLIRVGDRSAGIISFLPDEPGEVRLTFHSARATALALHQAIYHPGSPVLLVSPSLRQSGELFRKVVAHLRALDYESGMTESNRPPLARERLAGRLTDGNRRHHQRLFRRGADRRGRGGAGGRRALLRGAAHARRVGRPSDTHLYPNWETRPLLQGVAERRRRMGPDRDPGDAVRPYRADVS